MCVLLITSLKTHVSTNSNSSTIINYLETYSSLSPKSVQLSLKSELSIIILKKLF